MKTTIKQLNQLLVGDVIIDPQGGSHIITDIWPSETNVAGRRIYTDTYPEGRELVPIGLLADVLFHVEAPHGEISGV